MNIETLLLCLIVCMAGSVRSSRNQMFFAEKMLENKAVMSNLITKLHNISPTQCSYICLQQKCECFGFESNTKTCRIHAFCRLYSTSVDEAGWKYYRTGQCCNFSFAQILYFAVFFHYSKCNFTWYFKIDIIIVAKKHTCSSNAFSKEALFHFFSFGVVWFYHIFFPTSKK